MALWEAFAQPDREAMIAQIRSSISRRWSQLSGKAARHAGSALVGIDEIRRAVLPSTRQAAADEIHDLAPRAVFAVVPHWRPDSERAASERNALLGRCLDELINLRVDQVVAVVLTNEPQATAEGLSEQRDPRYASVPMRVVRRTSQFRGPWSRAREVIVLGWHPGFVPRHGWYLTWGHVPVLRRAAQTRCFSHLLYLEDDMRFTEQHLRYWCRYRKPLAQVGLLPGFARFEWYDGEKYLIDVTTPIDPTHGRRAITTDDGELCSHVVALANPYQAMYLLDRALSDDHFRFSRSRSPTRSRAGSTWKVRERAAAGPIFDDVPAGLQSRNVVPVRIDGSSQRLDPCCLIEHLAGTYSTNPNSRFGTLRANDLFGRQMRLKRPALLGDEPAVHPVEEL
jgi:hypothetical protein